MRKFKKGDKVIRLPGFSKGCFGPLEVQKVKYLDEDDDVITYEWVDEYNVQCRLIKVG